MSPNDEQQQAAHWQTVQQLQQITAFHHCCYNVACTTPHIKWPWTLPYIYSLWTGVPRVEEFLKGHPGCIHCELGVSRKVFLDLISTLASFGFGDSKYVKIEEQLTIFLYMSVTGLTIQHTGEQFQHLNTTILKYFHYMLEIFTMKLFYHIHQPSLHMHSTIMKDPWQPEDVTIFWPYSRCSWWWQVCENGGGELQRTSDVKSGPT